MTAAYSSFDREIGRTTVFCEASGEGRAAMLGVAYTLATRARLGAAYAAGHGGTPHPLFGSGHVSEAAMDPRQYSVFNDDQGDFRNLRRRCVAADADPILATALAVMDAAVGGVEPDPTDGATHYHDSTIDPPSWTEGATMTKAIGSIMFYANVK